MTYGTKPSYGGIVPTKTADDEYTYTFAGWATEAGQETGVADTALPEVTDNVIYYAAFSKTEITRYSITINYQDDKGTVLKDPHSESQKVGFEYSFDVSSDTTGDIPFIIMGDEKQYVFDHFTEDSGALSGELNGNVVITAVYLLDGNGNKVPDAYEATVTYKVVNGTWDGRDKADKTANFILKTFDQETNTWKPANPTPTLGETIPTDMKPDGTHIADGASWNENITANTAVTESKTYTYTFNTSVNSNLKVEKTLEKVNGKAYTTGKVEADDVLTYTVKVTNTGNVTLSNIVVTDTFTGSAAPTTTTADVTWTLDPASNSYKATWNVGALAAGADATLTYTYTVTDADVKAEKVTNNVSVTSNETPVGESGGTTTKVVGNYTIIASSGANGTISPNGSVTVAAGTDKTFTITADAGYHISDVTVDDKSVGVQSEYKFENVWGNHTIHATFAKNSNPTSYTLYYHPNFGGYKPFYQSSSIRSVTVKEYENVGRLPERDGYVFVSWNTEPDGSGERYMPGDTFHIKGSSDNLYAQWQKDKTGPDDSGVSNWLETDEHRAYLTGYPDSTFRADRNMTRAEVAQMFYALLLDKNVTITKSFSDVPDDAWYATAVKTLASLGMMDGYPDGTFRPDEPITRAEFATVGLAFAYDPLDASCSYYDVSASAWYHTYVAQATTYGWIGGYPDNTFRPGNNITRVEVCVIVNNMLGRDADERYIDRHEDELVHFVDLSDSYWGYYTIMESTNTHEYTGSFTNEKWTDVK